MICAYLEPRVPEELYDMVADPLERTNLVDDPAYADLSARLDQHMSKTADTRLGSTRG